MYLPGSLAFTALWLCQGSIAATRDAVVDLSSILNRQDWSPHTEISIPGESEFTNATTRWTEYRAPTYSAALSVGSEEGLVTAVRP